MTPQFIKNRHPVKRTLSPGLFFNNTHVAGIFLGSAAGKAKRKLSRAMIRAGATMDSWDTLTQTLNLDRLAGEGMLYERATQPRDMPSLFGKHHYRAVSASNGQAQQWFALAVRMRSQTE